MHSVSQPVFWLSNLTVKLVCKSETNFNAHCSSSSKSSNRYFTQKYSRYFVFEYTEYEGKKRVRNEEVYFSTFEMRRLKDGFEQLSETLLNEEVYEEVNDPEYGYLCGVTDKFNSSKSAKGENKPFMSIRGIEGKPLMFDFDVYEDESKNEIHKGVRIYIGSRNDSVFVTVDAFLALEMEVHQLNLLQASQNLVAMHLSERASKTSVLRKNIEESE
jgi:hypothetical protein